MRKLIVATLAAAALTGCGTILPAGYGVFAPEGSEERAAARAELANGNALIGAFAAGMGRAYARPQPPIQAPRMPIYTTCSRTGYSGNEVICTSQ